MSSRKRSSRRRKPARARSQVKKLVRNGAVMKIVIPVAIAGAGVAAYLYWKKSRENAAPSIDSDGTPNAAYLAAQRAGEQAPASALSPVDALIQNAGSTAKDAANAAYFTAQDAMKRAKAAMSGIGSYYDVSAAGAPYQGMFGLGSTAMSTVEPHDLARRAKNFAPVREVTRQFASPKVRTGGMFARDLFTGTMG